MKIQESGEMYLEAILVLKTGGTPQVRAIDVANHTGYSKPSVSRALGILKAIYERHNVLTAVFEKLGVDPKIAEEDACKIEHVISDETFEAVKKHYGYK